MRFFVQGGYSVALVAGFDAPGVSAGVASSAGVAVGLAAGAGVAGSAGIPGMAGSGIAVDGSVGAGAVPVCGTVPSGGTGASLAALAGGKVDVEFDVEFWARITPGLASKVRAARPSLNDLRMVTLL